MHICDMKEKGKTVIVVSQLSTMYTSLHAIIVVMCISTIILSDATTITQKKAVVRREGDSVHIKCEQDGKDQQMYWYRQGHQNGLELIFFSQMDGLNTEKLVVEDRFTVTRENRQRFHLNVTKLQPQDSAVYFCASSPAGFGAYFGEGTKLTVLEENYIISEPKVKILPPSKKEIKTKNRATLVCVATDFYPDHVSIAWKIKNRDETPRDETPRSKTDESAIRSDKSGNYSITSRLRVRAEEWQNTRNKFYCSVSFFDGNKTIYVNATIQGTLYCGTTAEENKWSGNAAELSYILVLVKSALFALFLATFVWKLKGSSAAKFLD